MKILRMIASIIAGTIVLCILLYCMIVVSHYSADARQQREAFKQRLYR